MNDYSLCYRPSDGKLVIGHGCTENKEKFVGEITDQIADVHGYIGLGMELVLTNFDFVTSADIALYVPGGTSVRFIGNNSISVIEASEDANIAVLYAAGDLVLMGNLDAHLSVQAKSQGGLWSRAICARAGNITVNGGSITAAAGSAKKNCGIYAGGHLFIDTKEKGRIDINAGTIRASALPNAIRAGDEKLCIAKGARVKNALEMNEYDKNNEEVCNKKWIGNCLTQMNTSEDLLICF